MPSQRILTSILLSLTLLLASAAAADPVAKNDSIDLADVIAGDTAPTTCPCFCTYEGFAATLTAPEDMTLNYIYLYYGTTVLVNTIFDFHMWQGDEAGGEYWMVGDGDDPSIGYFTPLQINAPQIVEIDVGSSGVLPQPQVLAGEQFTIGFHYNYDPDLGDIVGGEILISSTSNPTLLATFEEVREGIMDGSIEPTLNTEEPVSD